jgi:hypothetical protein
VLTSCHAVEICVGQQRALQDRALVVRVDVVAQAVHPAICPPQLLLLPLSVHYVAECWAAPLLESKLRGLRALTVLKELSAMTRQIVLINQTGLTEPTGLRDLGCPYCRECRPTAAVAAQPTAMLQEWSSQCRYRLAWNRIQRCRKQQQPTCSAQSSRGLLPAGARLALSASLDWVVESWDSRSQTLSAIHPRFKRNMGAAADCSTQGHV